ncbi:conserved Plasmodium protein, unknown function [Babesia microti strain RI]|uniref:HTH OST-type domain-containing protein n=1 Tax=Babesia microti (strain RI) TaxID=1133968 RepID=I7J8T1_BABMR|nr:conserved Plasmodium protein, unknown function [Babesia microti strain RI]CCF72994.1 conserved Plasmodium protein, unknown function [Babesia microti strain RI]|eukprot:XP_012647603.1 conserved Plasmodium protein, unknown function [Babesia microti strain RI]
MNEMGNFENVVAMSDVVYKIITTLYDDEIIPTIHEVRRRLGKLKYGTISGKFLIKICKSNIHNRFNIVKSQVFNPNAADVQNNLQLNLVILLKSKPIYPWFYPTTITPFEIKLIFDYIINSFSDTNKFGNGGRYLFAEGIKKNGPEELRNLSLGKLIKIVQAAIDLKILTYEENKLIPVYMCKTTSIGFLNRQSQSLDNLDTNFTSIYTIKQRILNLLDNYNIIQDYSEVCKDENNKTMIGIPLCRLPIEYKLTYGERLDYSTLGYSKLADFIKEQIKECKFVSLVYNQCIVTKKITEDSIEPKGCVIN